MEECRVAVIGIGKMGLLHASILNAIPGVRLIALCDQKNTIVKISKKFLGDEIKVVNDVALLSDNALNAVFVTTPITTHFKVIRRYTKTRLQRTFFPKKLWQRHMKTLKKSAVWRKIMME